MLAKLVVFALCMDWSLAATVAVNGRQAEPRSATLIPISQSDDQDSGLAGSKSGEPIVGPVTGVYGGYAGNQGQFQTPQGQPTAMNTYTSYGANGVNPYPSNNPILGLSTNGDLTLSAYFGPVVWGFVAGLALGMVVVWIINLVGGFEYLGTTLRGIGTDTKKTGGAKAKSLDLDQLASLVYAAMDKYNKWNGVNDNGKF